MDTSANRNRFLAYVADHPDARPAFHRRVRAMPAAEPPTFAYTMPLGDLFVFPEFLVFLTTTTDKPGGKIMVNFVVQGMTDYVKTGMTLNRWVAHPASILVDVAKALANSGPRDNKLEQALLSANSFFVPFDHLRAIVPGRQMTQGPYLKVTTHDASYIIHQDAAVESWWKGMSTLLGAPWEPEMTAYLQAAARHASTTRAKQ